MSSESVFPPPPAPPQRTSNSFALWNFSCWPGLGRQMTSASRRLAAVAIRLYLRQDDDPGNRLCCLLMHQVARDLDEQLAVLGRPRQRRLADLQHHIRPIELNRGRPERLQSLSERRREVFARFVQPGHHVAHREAGVLLSREAVRL